MSQSIPLMDPKDIQGGRFQAQFKECHTEKQTHFCPLLCSSQQIQPTSWTVGEGSTGWGSQTLDVSCDTKEGATARTRGVVLSQFSGFWEFLAPGNFLLILLCRLSFHHHHLMNVLTCRLVSFLVVSTETPSSLIPQCCLCAPGSTIVKYYI